MVASWAVYVMILALLVEVVGRYGFNAPTIWAHQLCQMLWGFYILWGGSYVLRHNAHVNLDLIYRRLSIRKKGVIDSITYLLFFVFVIAILWYGIPYAWESVSEFEYSYTRWGPPIWPLKMMIPLAISLLLLQGMAKYIRSLYAAITGSDLTSLKE